MKKVYKWVYKVTRPYDVFEIGEGEWTTDLSASEICKKFEDANWEVAYLNRVCKVNAMIVDFPYTIVSQSKEVPTYANT